MLLQWYRFPDLSSHQLYNLLMMRSQVFVVEQHCVYLDPDGKDVNAIHLLGLEGSRLIACLRLFPPEKNRETVLFGRVLTEFSVRKMGYGKILMQELLSYCEQHFSGLPIECSAQYRLVRFYSEFGFVVSGDVYDEDGMPHIRMYRD